MGNYIIHSAKGTTWGKHKYIAIRNGRYIYPDDTGSSGQPQVSKEYQEELEYNSRKNNYFGRKSSSSGGYPDGDTYSSRNRNSGDAGSSSKPQVSKEYQEELEYNSRKNNYFGRKSPSPGGYSDDDAYVLRNRNSSGISKINVNDFDRILDNREVAKKYNSERDYGRQETALEKRMRDPNYKRVISDRAFNKQHTLSKGSERPANGIVVRNARDEGRKAVQQHNKVQEKKAAINRATKNMERYARDSGRKATQDYKKAQAKTAARKAASDRISRAVRSVKTSAKSSVNKGRAVLSSVLSKFKRR